MKFETKVIHVGEEPDFREGASGDVVVPIHLSSTFARRKVEERFDINRNIREYVALFKGCRQGREPSG